jgi:hypothetical protein
LADRALKQMDGQNLENLTRVLQASISPVALISGVGLLVLSITNRLGRVMDRLRNVLDQKRSAGAPDKHLERQVQVLHRRARMLKGSVTAAVVCILFASVLVLLLFTTALLGARIELLVIVLFPLSLLSLIVALVLFLFDMNLSLKAVQEEFLR